VVCVWAPCSSVLTPGCVVARCVSVVRPHAWRIAPASSAGLPGKVLRSAFLGPSTEVWVHTTFGEILVLIPSQGAAYACGAPVSLFLSAQGVSVLSALHFPISPEPLFQH